MFQWIIIVFLFFILCKRVSNIIQKKDKTKGELEPGAVYTYPPAPTLRSQEFRCYKCEKLGK